MHKYCLVKIEDIDTCNITSGILENFYNKTLVISTENCHSLSLNTQYFIHIISEESGISTYEATLNEISDNKLFFNSTIFLFSKERRDSNRVLVNISLKVFEVYVDNNVFALSKPILMTAKNLSINGVLLQCSLDLPSTSIFILKFPINNKSINLTANCKRKFFKQSMYYYGCQFKLETEFDEMLLGKFILKNKLIQSKYKNLL